jgi:hypothetical protein
MAQKLSIDLKKGTQCSRFLLNYRPLDLGTGRTIGYYWMDSRQFRTRPPGPNYRACVDSWWADVEMAGDTDDWGNLANLVLAECFSLVNTSRSLQEIYRDAHLHEAADREWDEDSGDGPYKKRVRSYSLPREETRRLLALAERRSSDLVRAELEQLFRGPLPPEEQKHRFMEAECIWLGKGILAFQEGGVGALRNYLNAELAPWLLRYRKRGDDARTRLFINMFAYDCKVAFYLCYANAWIGLTRRLVDDHGLDPLSERFLRLWHHQNQPIEDPSAPSGGHPDVFCGQVLALHPLSAIFQDDPGHLAAIAAWIGHPDYEILSQQGREVDCPEYWRMVASILIAAHEYRHAHERWNVSRGVARTSIGDNGVDPARDDTVASAALLFEDYAHRRGIHCPQCHAPLVYRHFEPPGPGRSEVRVGFRCRAAGHETSVLIREEDLQDSIADS